MKRRFPSTTGLSPADGLATAEHTNAPDDWLDDGELTAAAKQLIEERIADFEKHPETSIPWAVAKEDLKRCYGS